MKKLLLVLVLFTANITIAHSKNFIDHVSSIKKELEEKGYDSSVVDKVFDNNFIIPAEFTKTLTNQPEFKYSFHDYLKTRLSDVRIQKGKENLKNNSEFLNNVYGKYKVKPEVIVALWGLETNYGTFPLKYNPVRSLVQISYNHSSSRRKAYFKEELFSLFELAERENINLVEVKSSWAGALGQCQFMPSNVLKYAVDGNNDSKIDIWDTTEDVLASIANFLKILGWKDYETEFVILDSKQKALISKSSSRYRTVSEWNKKGLNLNIKDKNMKLKLFIPENKNDKVFLVSQNFDIIIKWNNSDNFAFSVLKLASVIKG